MKRKKLIAYLLTHNCCSVREGGDHTIFLNFENQRKTTMPRHVEIDDFLAEKICKQLGLPKISRRK